MIKKISCKFKLGEIIQKEPKQNDYLCDKKNPISPSELKTMDINNLYDLIMPQSLTNHLFCIKSNVKSE